MALEVNNQNLFQNAEFQRFVDFAGISALGRGGFTSTSSARRSSRRACRSHTTSARTRRLKWTSSRGLQIALFR